MLGTAKTKKDRGKKKFKNLLIIFILLLIAITITIGIYLKNGLTAISAENPDYIDIEIPAGSTTARIANILKKKSLIKDEFIFKFAVKKMGAENDLKAGTYVLNTGMDIDTIIRALSKGGKNVNVVKFTIPEGYELHQMADKLSKDGLVDSEIFLDLVSDKGNFENKFPLLKELAAGQGLEGLLYPSTYEIYMGSSEEEIIAKMLAQFMDIYEREIEPNIGDSDLSFNEIVTLASIIEREGKLDEELELISAVFHNRLKHSMLLQSCATVQYALGERKGTLSDKDTQIESEFNTYIHSGLPPSPIASPGRKSLIAAISPAQVDYLYFRTKEDGTGGHTFSKTFEEHRKANPN